MRYFIIILLLCSFCFAGLDAGSGKVINVNTPTDANDAANKYYVDNIVSEGNGLVNSVNGFDGIVILDTNDINEGSLNLYYTDARARAAISETITGIDYSSGVFSITSGYEIPTAIYAADSNKTFADIESAGGILFKGDNDAGDPCAFACILAKKTNDHAGYEQGELWLGTKDNNGDGAGFTTAMKIDKTGAITIGPGFTPFGFNRQIAQDYIAESSPGDEVIGTDALNYRCIMRNHADASNRPITGKNWQSFWAQGGSAGIAWVVDTNYVAHLTFGERLSVFEGDQPDGKPLAVRNVKTNNDNTHTVGIGYSLYNDANMERMVGIENFGFWDATSGAEQSQYFMTLRNKGSQISGPYYKTDMSDSSETLSANIGPYGTRELVVPKDANYTILYTDTGKIFTNQGAKGIVVFTLPNPRQVGTGCSLRFRQGVCYLNGSQSGLKWILSPSGTGEYYAVLTAGGDPGLSEPNMVYDYGQNKQKGTIGSLAAGEWGYGDANTLGYSTIVIRDGYDPNGYSQLVATYKFRVKLDATGENSMFVPDIPSDTYIDSSVESDGLLGSGLDLISFGNPGAGAAFNRRWQGQAFGQWKQTGDTQGFLTLADNATPSVFGGHNFLTGGTTTITDFDNGAVGQSIMVIADSSRTITNGANIALAGGENYDMQATDILSLIQKSDGKWYQTGRTYDITDTNITNWNTAYSWGNHASAGYLTSVTAHNLLSTTHGDTLADTVVRGDILYGNATPKWARLAFPSTPTGKGLIASATDIEWSAYPVALTGAGNAQNWLTTGTLGAGAITGTSLTLGNAEFISNATNGIVRIGGAGGTYNNYIDFKLDVASSVVDIDTSATNFRFLKGGVFTDNQSFAFGGGADARLLWSTLDNDFLWLRMFCNSADDSGNLVLTNNATFPTPAYPIVANPTLRIQASSTTIAKYILFCHDQTNGVIDVGSGVLNLNPTGNTAVLGTLGVTGLITATGGILVRSVTDAGPMTATGGTQREIVFNTSDSKFYGCTVTHASAATWVALN